MQCPSCGSENTAGAKFCSECGTPFVRLCTHCGQQMQPTAKFCSECGTPLQARGKRVPTKRHKRTPPTRHTTPPRTPSTPSAKSRPASLEAERRQLTVMFCDLVGSTALSTQLDPEDYRAVVQRYQQTCTEVIQRHEGYLAQYLGDGLLVYFGYPIAHEDDARRAVRTGLEIVEALRRQNEQPPLPVRIGIHTGLVVVGEIGAGSRMEHLALGETPNIAARIQGLAEANTVIVSAATHHVIEGYFESQPFGAHVLKGLDTPVAVYHVQSERQSPSLLAGRRTLTPLVGREQEVGLLIDRWEQAKEGRGQVVLLSGEPGIGKSRLAYTLREHVTAEGSLLFEARCSPYYQHSAFYPLIDVLQRTLLFARQDTEGEKLGKLERTLALYMLQDALPLFATLLSLPAPAQYPPLTLTPQKQKERTLQALLQLLIAQAERQATVSVWEDLHWADPSSLEFLTLLVEQSPTTNLLLVLTFRPEFIPPWRLRSHLTQLNLNRIGKQQIERMVENLAKGQQLSADLVEQICAKTDGVPLFVEELTKSVLETVGEQVTGEEVQGRRAADLLAIPATLQEALLARLDRLSTARQIAQLGATLGREFSYELLRAVAPVSETDLQIALIKLVEAEILYQRGVGDHARYFFKHALIQDTAYQSLLKSTRQQYHQQTGRVLDEQFPDTKETQPELLAHHFTEAGLTEHAIPYWQKAGQRAAQRSANAEAIDHLRTALTLLKTKPDTIERSQQELHLLITLGPVLMATNGYAASEVERTFARARELCLQIGDTPQVFSVLEGLIAFYLVRADLQATREVAEQMLRVAQKEDDIGRLQEVHAVLGEIFLRFENLAEAKYHLDQSLRLHDSQRRYPQFLHDPGVLCLSMAGWVLWYLGFPDQAEQKVQEAIVRAQSLVQPFSLAFALHVAAFVSQHRREAERVCERTAALCELSLRTGFVLREAGGAILHGWGLTKLGQGEEGIGQIRQGITTWDATGAAFNRSVHLSILAEIYRETGQSQEGLAVINEAMANVDRAGDRFYGAELYRLKGELTLQKEARDWSLETSSSSQAPSVKLLVSPAVGQEAEEYFLKAIDIAQHQQAKSLELRAATSLARLWQQQGKQADAHKLLADVYNWFTEGFDTKDLQEAKALLENLT